MVTCPNCGHSVADSQRFCGNCGTDVEAALAAAPHGGAIGEGQPAPYAYSQPSGYGYEYQPPPEPAPTGRYIIIGAVLIIALCCAFSCGLLFGFEIIPDLFGGAAGATPVPKPSPTPQSLLPIIHYFIG